MVSCCVPKITQTLRRRRAGWKDVLIADQKYRALRVYVKKINKNSKWRHRIELDDYQVFPSLSHFLGVFFSPGRNILLRSIEYCFLCKSWQITSHNWRVKRKKEICIHVFQIWKAEKEWKKHPFLHSGHDLFMVPYILKQCMGYRCSWITHELTFIYMNWGSLNIVGCSFQKQNYFAYGCLWFYHKLMYACIPWKWRTFFAAEHFVNSA